MLFWMGSLRPWHPGCFFGCASSRNVAVEDPPLTKQRLAPLRPAWRGRREKRRIEALNVVMVVAGDEVEPT